MKWEKWKLSMHVMSKDLLIIIGGIHSLLFAIFHIGFWKIFSWKTALKKLNLPNRAIMQISNLCLIYFFLFVTFVCFFFTQELYASNLGKVFLCGISLFWLIRAIEQFIFLPVNKLFVHALTVLFLAGFTIFLLPVIL